MVSSRNIASALYQMAQTEHNGKKLVGDCVSYLERIHCLPLLPSVMKQLQIMEAQQNEFNDMRLHSAYALPDKLQHSIASAIGADTDRIKVVESPDLIGGFTVEHRGVVYDSSIQTQLRKLTQALTS